MCSRSLPTLKRSLLRSFLSKNESIAETLMIVLSISMIVLKKSSLGRARHRISPRVYNKEQAQASEPTSRTPSPSR